MYKLRDKSTYEKDFWSKVEKSEGCWIWKAYCSPRGYGQVAYEGRLQHAHRVAYRLEYGEIPEGLVICHKCDNPGCVRPDHLFAGTQLDNMLDMIRKGRKGKGSAKITPEDVIDIRRRRKAGEPVKEIAKIYNLHPNHISEIALGIVWSKVKPT